jgi:hypothetical protein
VTIQIDGVLWEYRWLKAFERYFLPLTPRVGDWHPELCFFNEYFSTQTDLPANVIHASYFPLFRRIRFDAIGIQITGAGAAGALVRLGVYGDNGSLYPGSLILDAGSVDASTTDTKPIAIDLTLEPGVYWLAALSNDGTIGVKRIFSAAPFYVTPDAGFGRWTVSYAYGSLPNPYPSGGGRATNWVPAIMLRVAEVFP